ncbi:MAG: glycosyltransferase family 39 protein [Blastocatellia bacterium]|nr:glycosyltransferase family 39 protein [Blastocatellia bacterium]
MAKKAKKTEQQEATPETETSARAVPIFSDKMWYLSSSLVVAVAAFLRFFWLELKPLHHDEGVNGFFLTTLFREGIYRYDPSNYHGPTLYYISLAFAKWFGLETVPVRLSTAIFGVLMVVLALFLSRYIGRTGALFAALFLSLSPGMVFISRYFIHEIFFVFLALAFALAAVYFIDREKAGPFAYGWLALLMLISFYPTTLNLAAAAGEDSDLTYYFVAGLLLVVSLVLIGLVIRMLGAWSEGRPVYLILASASAALMFATKETAFITLGTMAIAVGCVWIWRQMYPKMVGPLGEDERSTWPLTWANFSEALGTGIDRVLALLAAGFAFVYLNVLFFTSYFSYSEGFQKAFEAYAIWTETGSSDHTQNGPWAYLKWGMELEAPIFILAGVGVVIAFVLGRHRFALFTALWGVGLLMAYSIIPYKTPWLMLSFLLPMCIIAGYAINEIAAAGQREAKWIAAILGIGASVVLAYQTYDLNFIRYDDNGAAYVYAHTRREFHDLIGEIERFSELSGKGNDAAVDVISSDYWPMVWYTKDRPRVVFHGRPVEPRGSEMIVAKKGQQDAEVIRRYSAQYAYVASYGLRPGVDLILLVRKDLIGTEGQELYKLNMLKP